MAPTDNPLRPSVLFLYDMRQNAIKSRREFKGIQFVIDDSGKKKTALIHLEEWGSSGKTSMKSNFRSDQDGQIGELFALSMA